MKGKDLAFYVVSILISLSAQDAYSGRREPRTAREDINAHEHQHRHRHKHRHHRHRHHHHHHEAPTQSSNPDLQDQDDEEEEVQVVLVDSEFDSRDAFLAPLSLAMDNFLALCCTRRINGTGEWALLNAIKNKLIANQQLTIEEILQCVPALDALWCGDMSREDSVVALDLLRALIIEISKHQNADPDLDPILAHLRGWRNQKLVQLSAGTAGF